MTYAFKYDAFKYDFTIPDKQKCLSCLFFIQTSGETDGEFPNSPPLSQDYQWYSRCYTCVMTSMQIKPSSSWSVPISIYLWRLVTATSTDLSHHLKYFYCVYFDGRPSNSCVIHLAGQDVLYLMQLYTISAQ